MHAEPIEIAAQLWHNRAKILNMVDIFARLRCNCNRLFAQYIIGNGPFSAAILLYGYRGIISYSGKDVNFYSRNLPLEMMYIVQGIHDYWTSPSLSGAILVHA